MKISFNIEQIEAILSDDYGDESLKKFVKEVDLSHINPLQRRRLSQSARYVFSLLNHFKLENTPIVFSSSHGEINRCFDMLEMIAKDEAISPTSFSLSVHNAIISQFAIFSKNTQEISAISSSSTLEMALLDAYLKLSEGYEKVLIVSHYENISKDALRQDFPSYALALLVKKGEDFTLESIDEDLTQNDSTIAFLKHFQQSKTWKVKNDNEAYKYTCNLK